MTIQLLQTWNGKPAGIYTFDAGEETRLIGLGLARAYFEAIDGGSGRGGSVVAISAATLAAPTAAMLADTRTFYELQTTRELYRSNNGTLALVGSGGYLGSGDQTAMRAVGGEVVGALYIRTDTSPSSTWQLDALPASTLANWREVGSAAPVARIAFSGAVTDSLVWVGPGRLMQCVVTAGAVGSITIKDQIAAGTGPTVATLTTAAAPDTFPINSGAGSGLYAGITLTIVGANTGYLLVRGD